MKRFDIIATLSKRVHKKNFLQQFVAKGVTIFRINGSHTPLNDIESMLREIRLWTNGRAKVLIDLPGSKIRLQNFQKPLVLMEGSVFTLKKANLNHPELLSLFQPGQLLLANDGTFQFKPIEIKENEIVFQSLIHGTLLNGKGINIQGHHPSIPFLHERDYRLIELAIKNKVEYIGFSYVREPSDIVEANRLLKNTNTECICKIETSEACKFLNEIISLTKTILIDRGDLSSEIGIHEVPYQIKRIVGVAKKLRKKIFFATQFLHYMINHPIPSISEVIVLHEALSMADGLQLSEETAVGKYPFKVLDVIQAGLQTVSKRKDRTAKKQSQILV